MYTALVMKLMLFSLLYDHEPLTFSFLLVPSLKGLDLWSSRIHSSFAFGCLWGPFAFFALFRVVCNIGGVFGVSI